MSKKRINYSSSFKAKVALSAVRHECTISEIRNSLKNIIGEKCWDATNVVTGTLTIYFGGVLLQDLISLPKDTNVVPVGQYDILIWSEWRLDDKNEILCSSRSLDETIAQTVFRLIGDNVVEIEIFPPVWDAVITFSSGKKLKIFCDYVQNYAGFTNWDIGINNTNYHLGEGNKLGSSKRLGILPYKPFSYDKLPPLNIDKRLECVRKEIPYDQLLEIGTNIKEKYSDE
jgi:hypothetical protein